MIIVTGATGQLGGTIVRKLLDRVPATRLGVSVRDPDLAADLEALGVRVRQGDYDDRDSLRNAFEGCSRLLLVSSNAAASGGDRGGCTMLTMDLRTDDYGTDTDFSYVPKDEE